MDRRLDWDQVELVVFDVDGTLYDQRKVRICMAFDLLKSMDSQAATIIFAFRRIREKLGQAGDSQFLTRQFELVSDQLKISAEEVRATVAEWIEERPLRHIAAAAVPGVADLFSGLRRTGRRIAIFSDYPASRKLEALDLAADLLVSSTDGDVARLKPDPSGLLRILEITGIAPERSLMIGDRPARDGAAATTAGVSCLIRNGRRNGTFTRFRTFRDAIFDPVVRASLAPSQAAIAA